MIPNDKHRGAMQQTLARRRDSRNACVFLSAVAGVGFVAAKLLAANSLPVTILLLITLAFFVLGVGAMLVAFQCQISTLQRTLAERPPGMTQRVLEWAEWIGSIGFVLAVLVLIAAIIVHLSLGGIAQTVEPPAASVESNGE